MKKLLVLLMITCLVFPCPAKPSKESVELITAIGKGDLEKVKELVEKDPTLVNSQGNLKVLPLNEAISKSKADIIDYLLKKGADVNLEGLGGTALHVAVNSDSAKIIPELMRKGADLKATDNNRETPLHKVKENVKIAKYLLKKGAEIDAKGKQGYTPLMRQMYWSGRTEMIEVLLGHGADINTENNDGETLVHQALKYGKEDYYELLLKKGAKFTPRSKISTALHYAVQGKNLSLVTKMLEKGIPLDERDQDGNTPLHAAARVDWGEFKLIRLLLDKGADKKALNKKNKLPLNIAEDYNEQAVSVLK